MGVLEQHGLDMSFDVEGSATDSRSGTNPLVNARIEDRTGKLVGYVHALVIKREGVCRIHIAKLSQELQGKGIGREAYLRLHAFVKQRFGLPLASDTERSAQAEGLWKGLERAGKAKLQQDGTYVMVESLVIGRRTGMSVWKKIEEAFGFPGGAASNSIHSRLIEVWGQDMSDAFGLIEEVIEDGKTSHETASAFQEFLTLFDKDTKLYVKERAAQKPTTPNPSTNKGSSKDDGPGSLQKRPDSWNRPDGPLDYRPGVKK